MRNGLGLESEYLISYILIFSEGIDELPSQAVTNPLEIWLISLVVILPRAWHLTSLLKIDQPLLFIMREAVPSSLLHRSLKDA